MKPLYPGLAQQLHHNGRHPWALIIEDDDDLRWSALMILQDANVKALGASNGIEAMRIVVTALHEDKMPFIVFLDLNMPILNGWDILYWVEVAQPKIKNIQIVVTTGEANLPEVEPGIRFLKKPYSDVTLMSEVNRLLVKGEIK